MGPEAGRHPDPLRDRRRRRRPTRPDQGPDTRPAADRTRRPGITRPRARTSRAHRLKEVTTTRIGGSLCLIALGAILTFAIHVQTRGFSIHTIGAAARTPTIYVRFDDCSTSLLTGSKASRAMIRGIVPSSLRSGFAIRKPGARGPGCYAAVPGPRYRLIGRRCRTTCAPRRRIAGSGRCGGDGRGSRRSGARRVRSAVR